MSKRKVVELKAVQKTEIRYIETEYNGNEFGLEYDAAVFRTPEIIMMFESFQEFGEKQIAKSDAQAKLDDRAAVLVLSGKSAEEAKEQAEKDLRREAATAKQELKFDSSASSRALARLISWLGLSSDGVLLEPTEAFFRTQAYEFHGALFSAMSEDVNRPTNATIEPSPDASLVAENADTCQSSIEPSVPQDLPAQITESSLMTTMNS